MNLNVKEFIEDTIDLIESEDWLQLFTLWYAKYSMFDVNQDRLQLTELFNTLSEAGLGDIKAQSYEARKQIIVEHIIDYIDDLTFDGEEYINMVGCLNSLGSRLCLGLIELKQIFIDTCESRGLKATGSVKSQFKLK